MRLIFYRSLNFESSKKALGHCGIYVGNSIMLHCGDPISYTNLNSKYWQEHFYSYGRLP